MGKQDKAETTIAALEVLPEPFRQTAVTLVEICAYAGTGNVLKIQQLLHICAKHYEQEKEPEKKDKKKEDKKEEKKGATEEEVAKEDVVHDLSGQQAVAVLGLGLISMGEDIGSEMLYRTLGHLMRFVIVSYYKTDFYICPCHDKFSFVYQMPVLRLPYIQPAGYPLQWKPYIK